VFVRCEHVETLDTLALAQLLGVAISDEKPDLILTGLQSDDLGLGQTGVVLAQILGIPHATIIMDIEARPDGIRVKRELEDGWFQHVDMPLPALLTIQSGICRLRYASLLGIKGAKTKEIRTVEAPKATASGPVTLERVYAPERKKQTRLIEGTATVAAAQLVEVLRNEVRAL
jgi:electron transfer flavoprotein beta subunit